MNPMQLRTLIIGLLAVGAFALAGCRGPRNFTNENDRLREENLKLSREIQDLQQQLQWQAQHARALSEQLQGSAQPVPGAQLPTLAALEFGRYSGAIDTNSDHRDDLVRIYLQTRDQDGRFLPVAGQATLQAVEIPETGEPWTLAQRTFSPEEFRQTYRTGLTGTHYTLELPLPADIPADLSHVTVKLTFTDAGSGVQFTQEQAMPIDLGQ
jgi:hypothetical protein